MKKQLIIIIGVGIILILLLIWAYLLFFGTPKSGEQVIDNLGLSENNPQVLDTNTNSNTASTSENTNRPKLRQLTTKPVAGFNEIRATTTDNLTLYYVEMGTGHIYSQNLETGVENRISATTIAGINTALISNTGEYVVMSNKNNKNSKLFISKISTTTEEIVPEELSSQVDQFKISLSGNNLLYTTKENFGLAGYSYNLKSGSNKEIFKLPFHEAVMQWGNEASDTHYFYPKSSYLLEGYLYKVKDGKTSRLPIEGFGLTALANDNIAIYSAGTNSVHKNYVYNLSLNTRSEVPFTFLPEKCLLALKSTKIICAWENKKLPLEFPDAWYKGSMSYQDSIWIIYGNDLSSTLVVDTLKESGRGVDITNLSIGNSEKALYFINKNDNTLWMYEF